MATFFDNNIDVFGNATPVTTIDSHTEGEATRLIVSGLETILGKTMAEKVEWFKTRYDHVRSLLTKEPRGSKEILAAAVTGAVSPNAAFGLIYMDAKRYLFLCGHATIGAIVTLAKTGFLKLAQGENKVRVDTPSGMMEARVTVDQSKVTSVAIDIIPSFVFKTDQIIDVPGFGKISVDLVCTGGFFAMVDSRKLGISAGIENKAQLTDLGMKIIDQANQQLNISHPLRPDVNTVDVTEFYDSEEQGGQLFGKGMVIYGESHADRSPCGTGTAAKLALLHHYGKIKMHQPYTNYSPLGTTFDAQIIRKEKIGPFDAWVSQIRGMAYITGVHQFYLEDHDPFQKGFII